MNPETALILGAGLLQIPAIRAARDMGYRVIAADVSHDAPGMALADEAALVPKGDIEALVHLGHARNVVCVFSMASDLLAVQAAKVAARLGLPSTSEEAVTRATRKDLMHRALTTAGVPCPRFAVVSEASDTEAALDRVGLPAVAKPVDSSGSRGVIKLTTTRCARAAFDFARQHSSVGLVIIESFMSGREVSIESLTIAGKTLVVMITDKLITADPLFVEIGHSQPADLLPTTWEEIESLTCAAVSALGLDRCATHTEVKLTPGGPRVVEVGPRLGGDFITSHLVPLSTGVDLVRASLELALGKEPAIHARQRLGTAIRYFLPPPGRVRVVQELPVGAIDGVVELRIYVKPGDIVFEVTDSSKRSGHVITRAGTAAEAIRRAEAVLALNLIETTPVTDGCTE